MSRTYRHTKGNKKRIKGHIRNYIFTWYDERSQNIDYNDSYCAESALSIRKGKYPFGVPRDFRKNLNKEFKSEMKSFLYKVKQDIDSYDGLALPVEKKNAGYLYW